jgi:type VI secretion system secreted protein Hcp
MKRSYFLPFVLSLLSLLPTLFLKAQTPAAIAYVTVQGSKQGNFKGSENVSGKQGSIECIGFSYMVQDALDQASGAPVGKHTHSPVMIVKRLDATTPQFLQAAYTNESLKSVIIEFTKRSADGKTIVSKTVTLTNAMVSRVSQFGGTTATGQQLQNAGLFEEISLIFQKIEFTDNEAKIGTTDNWSTSR